MNIRSQSIQSYVFTYGLILGLILGLSGCARVQSYGPAGAAPSEWVLVDHFLLLADASISLVPSGKLRQEMEFLRFFIQTMPDGRYDAGFLAFNTDSVVLKHLSPFSRGSLISAVSRLEKMSGDTRLERSLEEARQQVQGLSGNVALLIVSDGRDMNQKAVLQALSELVNEHRDHICVHAVQIGSDETGMNFLRRISQTTNCGIYRSADVLQTDSAMYDFVRQIFYGSRATPPPAAPSVGLLGDSDGDGVSDSLDECPDTPKGAKVDERGCWVISNVLFDYDRFELRPEFFPVLDEVVTVLQNNPEVRVLLEGHADARGSQSYNQRLSERRAMAVMAYLVDRGISRDRLSARGWGESRPVAPNTTEENMQKNRRVELTPMR
ncbi:MAG: OmpA family protein [Candidatus Omnitrophica bacterium]|nr:OmpA family protein [Candidatus Omnitrophota bacterium]